MYTERDMEDIRRRIRRDWLALALAAIVLLAAYVAGMLLRVKPMMLAAGVLLVVAVIFLFLFFLLPDLRYRRFLMEMGEGLMREACGNVLSVSDEPELQDGARVLRVHLMLDEPRDERILYLNASKRERFPGVGTWVRLQLCGRHIAEVLEAREPS